MTEEDCVPPTHAKRCGRRETKGAENNSGGEKNESAEMLKRC